MKWFMWIVIIVIEMNELILSGRADVKFHSVSRNVQVQSEKALKQVSSEAFKEIFGRKSSTKLDCSQILAEKTKILLMVQFL